MAHRPACMIRHGPTDRRPGGRRRPERGPRLRHQQLTTIGRHPHTRSSTLGRWRLDGPLDWVIETPPTAVRRAKIAGIIGGMNEGTAALIAGFAGMAGALGGAFVGALAAVRGARIGAEKAAETARQQVEDQASVDHYHWLRQQRLEAYTALLTAYDAYSSSVYRAGRKVVSLSPGAGIPEEEMEEVSRARLAIRRERQRVKLVGPPLIHSQAVALEDAVRSHHDSLKDLAEAVSSESPQADNLRDAETEKMHTAAVAHDSFVRAVGSLLEVR